jgi:hypothetical protein
VNFASALNCKRCGAAAAGVQTTPPPVGIVLEDGYVLPPPPSAGSGVWRDGKTLIMTKDASLPDQCVKCNAPAHGFRLKRNLSWHHPAIYLVILVAWVIYIVLAIALSKRATVFLGLCTEHYKRRRSLLIVGWIMLAIGLISPIVAFVNEYPGIGLLGILLLLISVFWLVLVSRVVKVKKIDDRLIWLTGIDPNYLAQFPVWQGQ